MGVRLRVNRGRGDLAGDLKSLGGNEGARADRGRGDVGRHERMDLQGSSEAPEERRVRRDFETLAPEIAPIGGIEPRGSEQAANAGLVELSELG